MNSPAADTFTCERDALLLSFMRTRIFRYCALVFALAWMIRLLAALLTDRVHELSRMDMERVALSLAHSGVLGNPFLTSTGPSALVPPGYVLGLAAIFHLFGTGPLAEAVKIISCSGASSLRCALTPWFAFRLNLPASVIVVAGILSVFWIGAFDTELQGDWDAPYTTILVILLIHLHYSRPITGVSAAWPAVLGLLWGCAALVNPTTLSILFAYLILEVWRGGKPTLGKMLRRTGCLVACLLMVLFPWALRNRLALGSWVWMRSGFGLELELSYHDGSSWANAWNIRPSMQHPGQPNHDSILSHHPDINPAESRRVEKMGEIAYSHEKLRRALGWIQQNPSRSLLLAGQHAFYFWFPPGPSFYLFRPGKLMIFYSLARSLLTVFAFAGLWMLSRTHRLPAAFFGSILLFFPMIYYVVNWSSRYRAPIEWLLVLLASVPIAWSWDRFIRTRLRFTGVAPA
jgi:hypothetical protein